MSHLNLLQQAIATLEAQRSTLGDAVVDVSVAALRKQWPTVGGGQGEEQRKLVTVLFADLAGFTDLAGHLDPEDVRDLQDAYFAAITPPILVHGGSVEKYVGDAILAVFGVPESHEDDALRAVYAGLDMQQALRELNLGQAGKSLAHSGSVHLAMRIAIHTGLVVSRVAPDEGVFLVSGDTVNMTAHLQETAEPGTVLISDATQKLVAGAFAIRPLTPIHIRGKDGAISIFEVEGVVAPNQRAQRLQSPLVGRQTELRRVQESIVQLRTGRGGVIAISGEAGIGKSRLVAEAKRTIRTLAAPPFPLIVALPRWVETRCVSSLAAPPYALWIDVLHALLNIDQQPSSQAVVDQLDAWLCSSGDGRCHDFLPPLVHLLGLQDREPIEAIAAKLGKRTFAKGMVLFHKGSPGQRLYLIESGQVRIFVLSDEGHEITLNVHGPGECFGELALLDGGSRSASAVAMDKLVAYTLDREDFLGLLEVCPVLARHTLALVSGRVRHLTMLFESLAFLDIHGRVAACLLDLAERHGEATGDGVAVPLHLTQADLATYVAATRESVNKVLGGFRDEGLIRQDGHVLIILDPTGLQKNIRY